MSGIAAGDILLFAAILNHQTTAFIGVLGLGMIYDGLNNAWAHIDSSI
ncbi:hypothetical protein XBFM1_2710002 [Xenorhabdus bovienii str. feltiae Moldova]|uniref:Uncharacterized protein n=1 Tax=Xenorhabdus bovienii str. feltiae Moldova TaxID=1398200 RepID=A0A077NKA9_XENBV|nr:hypothetical protein XBFM1_2710002 [Xenorhabdus bovienii str. feltiae Moldova]